MDSVGDLNVKLYVDQAKFQKDLGYAQKKLKHFSDKTVNYLNNIEKAANSINRLNQFQVFGYAIPQLTRGLVEYADSYTEIANRMRLVNDTSAQVTSSMQSIFDISMMTNQSVSATSQIYQRFAQNAEQLSLSQSKIASLTETVSKAVAVSGASAASAQAALMQFGQSLASGVFRGQEFNSVAEQTPGLLMAIAKGLGVSIGELRKMANTGKLATSEVIRGLENAKNHVDKQFATRVLTISAALENLHTGTLKWIGEANELTGASTGIANSVSFLTDNVEAFSVALATAGIAMATTRAKNFRIESDRQALSAFKAAHAERQRTTSILSQRQAEMSMLHLKKELAITDKERLVLSSQITKQERRLTAAIHAEAAAQKKLAVAQKMTSTSSRFLNGAMGLFGGPYGVAAIAISGIATAFYDVYREAEEARKKALEFADTIPEITKNLEKLNSVELEIKIGDAKVSIEEQKKQIKDLREEYEKLKKQFEQKTITVTDELTGEVHAFAKSTKLLEKQRYALMNATYNLNVAENKLAQTMQFVDSAASALPITQITDKLKDLYPYLDISKEGVESFGYSIDEWNRILPKADGNIKGIGYRIQQFVLGLDLATNEAIKFKEAVEEALNPEVAKSIEDNELNLEILKARNSGDTKKEIQLKAKQRTRSKLGDKFDEKSNEYKKLYQSNLKYLQEQGKSRSKYGRGNKSQDSWLSFYDNLVNKNSSSLAQIEVERSKHFKKLSAFISKGVVTHDQATKVKLAIEENFAKKRLELAAQYSPSKRAELDLQNGMANIQELQGQGALSDKEAQIARQNAQFQYAQQMSQNAVTPMDSISGMYDPNQEEMNRQTEELARLQAFYDQKLMSEEDYQKRKQEIIDRYRDERTKEEQEAYAQSSALMSSAFDTMAGVMENAAGKQSGAYKAMFAISKGFAIATASINAGLALSEAAKLPFPQNMVKYAEAAALMAKIVSSIQSVQMSFATGGYTGDGGKYTPAGVVHRGEYVITKEATSRLGRGFLDQLNYGVPRRGFANGGGVGVPNLPTPKYKLKPSSPNVTVKVINNGEPTEAAVKTERDGNDIKVTVELMKQIARQETHNALVNGFVRSGGQYNRR
ncbi:tape measure protein [Pasteurella atlantica]|uniref:Tape measure protein n=2 Tax=Pasteurellaceae TaxID=712 RepID=A0ACC6HJP1_9PAST|nr:tape measure protein [Pasteurella atlantica]MDP8051058.1 tape measure protein [Pasteurella atlantica]MDP8104354.1 tape measure protein [Pasteurella atlantica]MDP8147714.1 tape measure protein [Pasteurella atlantica]